jgi:hypothetical protein
MHIFVGKVGQDGLVVGHTAGDNFKQGSRIPQ